MKCFFNVNELKLLQILYLLIHFVFCKFDAIYKIVIKIPSQHFWWSFLDFSWYNEFFISLIFPLLSYKTKNI